jgi:hypothetical protein
VRIAGRQAQIGREEIAKHVDLAALEPGTEVRAYVVAHEGESRPINPDTGHVRPLLWGRAVVRRVAELARAGVKFVRSHTDSTEVGEVLGSWTAEVAGKLRAIVAGTFKPGAANGMDLCSIEADGVRDIGGTVTEVGILDRIALLSSRHDKPGFPDAALSGAIFAISDGGVDTPSDLGDGTGDGSSGGPMTIKDIKLYLEQNPGILPIQLFNEDQIEAHSSVVEKLRKHEATNAGLTRSIGRRSAKDAMLGKVKDWTDEAKFHADTAFDGWDAATDSPAKLDEWIKSTGERFKGRTGKDVLPPPVDPDAEADEQVQTPQPQPQPVVRQPQQAPQQPNQPPSGKADPVDSAFKTLGILQGAAA